MEQFRKESEGLAGISVPNIGDIYDVGEFTGKDGKRPYFVVPLLEGANLGAILDASESRLDLERLVGIICQACKGLQTAHNRNVIHRDLKPTNLFVLEEDSLKIIDFGVAHLAGKIPVLRSKAPYSTGRPSSLDGKPAPQSDIFSLGVVCYQALTGRTVRRQNHLGGDDLKNCISTSGIDQWYRIARQHLDNKHFAKSREAADEILKLDPAQKPASELKENNPP